MTNAIDADGNAVAPTSNLAPDNNLRFTARDIQAEKVADGRYSHATPYLSDDEANNNPNIVIRDGSRQHVSGGYREALMVPMPGACKGEVVRVASAK